jgi:hypothetical protein
VIAEVLASAPEAAISEPAVTAVLPEYVLRPVETRRDQMPSSGQGAAAHPRSAPETVTSEAPPKVNPRFVELMLPLKVSRPASLLILERVASVMVPAKASLPVMLRKAPAPAILFPAEVQGLLRLDADPAWSWSAAPFATVAQPAGGSRAVAF